MNTLFWHDYETWGTSPAQDKPSQFAGVRTDEALNIIDDPLVCYCQPASDTLPQPDACLITGITPQKALAEGLPEPAFIEKIHQQLVQPGTCSVGYNSIRFDDEVTRYSLYRNFYDPYEREWKNGNSRWDIIDMVRLSYALRPESFQWPTTDEGQPSFKLELLSAANGLEHKSAHDAFSDVEATIGLAKLIKEKEPQLYDYAYSLRHKRKVASLIDVANRKPLLHISSRFPSSQGCAALIIPLAWHPRNKNSVICYNLSIDPTPLLTLSPDEIVDRLYTRSEDLPEGCERIPLKEVHLNKSPIIATPKLLDDANAKRLHIDKTVCETHWRQLKDADIADKLHSVYQQRPMAERTDPEQQLYDGFISDSDRQICTQLRSASPQQLATIGQQLSDKRLQALLFRYRARFYLETLNEQEQEQWQQWRFHRLSHIDGGASLTLDDYFERLEVLSQEGRASDIINALYDYGDSILA